jgi:hypothetical protein
MKSKTTLGLISLLSSFVFAAGCATGGESETESLGETQQAITTDAASPAASVASKLKKQAAQVHLAGALATTTVNTQGHTLDQIISVPAGTTVTCTTVGATTLDTVLAILALQNPGYGTDGPADSPYNAQKGWNLLAFNDDDLSCNHGYQSTVSWYNPNGDAKNVRVVGFLYGSNTNFGTATVTCTNATPNSISGNFYSNSALLYQTSPTITLTSAASNPDTTLLAIATGSKSGVGCDYNNGAQVPSGNSASNEDCPAGGPVGNNQSCLMNMNTGTYYWVVDIGGWGSQPRSSTVTF